jgi:hypothetical protein
MSVSANLLRDIDHAEEPFDNNQLRPIMASSGLWVRLAKGSAARTSRYRDGGPRGKRARSSPQSPALTSTGTGPVRWLVTFFVLAPIHRPILDHLLGLVQAVAVGHVREEVSVQRPHGVRLVACRGKERPSRVSGQRHLHQVVVGLTAGEDHLLAARRRRWVGFAAGAAFFAIVALVTVLVLTLV